MIAVAVASCGSMIEARFTRRTSETKERDDAGHEDPGEQQGNGESGRRTHESTLALEGQRTELSDANGNGLRWDLTGLGQDDLIAFTDAELARRRGAIDRQRKEPR